MPPANGSLNSSQYNHMIRFLGKQPVIHGDRIKEGGECTEKRTKRQGDLLQTAAGVLYFAQTGAIQRIEGVGRYVRSCCHLSPSLSGSTVLPAALTLFSFIGAPESGILFCLLRLGSSRIEISSIDTLFPRIL